MLPSVPVELHIVALDIPYPPDYGGAIDMYYRIQSLHKAGVQIYLHCFQYAQKLQAPELDAFCKKVWYYPRHTGLSGISLALPYMIYSRRNKVLLQRLRSINAPILFEGIHTSLYLNDAQLKDRFKLLRNHNIEHDYLFRLSQKVKGIFKRTYFRMEAALTKKYENRLSAVQAFLPISLTDAAYFNAQYPTAKTMFIPPYHPYTSVCSKPGLGDYCLFHGNLQHPENKEAILYLIKEVFPHIQTPIIIAGRHPDEQITNACAQLAHCRLIPNPSALEMNELISNAHIQLMFTFQDTGMKIKLMMALFSGRFVMANNFMLHGTGLNELCTIANSSREIINGIAYLMQQPFTQQHIVHRQLALSKDYNNNENTIKILEVISH